MSALALREDNIDRYVAEISKHRLLTREAEFDLATRYRNEGDVAAAHELVVSNLRFVVKIAHEYKGYGFKLLDLIQEGNVGLMMAVKKFEPEKGYRLISYAVWWIRSQIRSYIVRSFSLVKMGTTLAQRKLFFSMRSAKSKAEQLNPGQPLDRQELAKTLGVEASELSEMEMRMAARDFSLDAQLGDDSKTTHLDVLADGALSAAQVVSQEDALVEREQQHLLHGKVAEAMETLNEKERYIVEQRLLSDEPLTLQEIGEHFSVSRERVRQLESRVIRKLRTAFEKHDAGDEGVAYA